MGRPSNKYKPSDPTIFLELKCRKCGKIHSFRKAVKSFLLCDCKNIIIYEGTINYWHSGIHYITPIYQVQIGYKPQQKRRKKKNEQNNGGQSE